MAVVPNALLSILCSLMLLSPSSTAFGQVLPVHRLAVEHYGNDAPWYEANVPFFDCSDPELTQIYYYRWKLYKAHLRDLGSRGYIVTEFLDDVSWAKGPYQSLNDATGFHIYEGRWLRDRRYVDDYIDYMYTGGGNDRHFSEAIADAVWADYLATGDRKFATKHVDVMQHIFNLWDDHFDFGKGLYWITPILDATEYSIASIEASGGKDGFWGGEAFRPTINSYMYGNAVAIANLADLQGEKSTARLYRERAWKIRKAVEENLWSDSLQGFIDRFQVNNENVKYWTPIDGRELAGYSPWYFNLPENSPKYTSTWKHVLSPQELGGPHGIRTVEPSFKYYMKQYRYDQATGKPECQWNGPSWPFQTTQALVGMANLLNNYRQTTVSQADYVRLLRQYAHQHYRSGTPDLQEDYNPDTGDVIVGLPRSHHYNHSDFEDLIITGLVGLRPRADNVLDINPLVAPDGKAPNRIDYFCLDGVAYHGHLVTILYDRSGKRYHQGAGLSAWVDGKRVLTSSPLTRTTIAIASPHITGVDAPVDVAVNLMRSGSPAPSASVNTNDVYGAVDGRVWFFDNVANGWSNAGSTNRNDWYSIDFGGPRSIRSVRLYWYAGEGFAAPRSQKVQYWDGERWVDGRVKSAAKPIANGENVVTFARTLSTSRLRVVFDNPAGKTVRLVELKAFSPSQ